MSTDQSDVSLSERGQEIIFSNKTAETILQFETTWFLGHLLMNYCDNPEVNPIAEQFPIVELSYKIEELGNNGDDSKAEEMKAAFEELNKEIAKLAIALKKEKINFEDY